uniref:Transmembrane protein 60 n=1 Tax=Ditylenchus dipsaci TaxID=166011 RepID=A0A915EW77_9BILA
MAIGQRALFVWIFTLLTLIFLVIYLDGGLDGEPLIFFILLWLLDASCLGVLALRCIRFYYSPASNADEITATAFASEMPKLNVRQAGYAAMVLLSKLAFEVVLCVQLRSKALTHIAWLMMPLWLSLCMLIGQLSMQVVEVHKKVH